MDNIKRMDERQAALHDHFPSTHYLHKQENVMRLMEWITFYRRNPSRFVEHYFGIVLHLYQHIILYLMEFVPSFNISAVFIEDIQLRVNVQSFKKLAQLQGVLINLFEKNEYLYDFIAPTQWQNYCKARGRSSKEIKDKIKALEASGKKESKILSIQAAKEMYGIDTDNDNLADAIMIGHFVINNYDIRLNQDDQIKIEKHEK